LGKNEKKIDLLFINKTIMNTSTNNNLNNISNMTTKTTTLNIKITEITTVAQTINPLVGILGHGEIGSSLHKVYDLVGYQNVVIRDPYQNINNSLSECDMINVCIPFFGYDKFVEALKDLNLKDGCIIIIQSTIGLGTTDKVQEDIPKCVCVQSPVRGVHPYLTQGMLTFEKYMGVSEAYFQNKEVTAYIKNHLESLNMKPVMCRAKESELAKMVSTTLYGVNIAAINDVADLCEQYEVDFGTVFTRWQTDYNKGYIALGKPNVCRPVLTPIPKNGDGEKIIGGHCVCPNSVILKNMGEKNLSSFVLRYSNEKGRVHQTGAKH